jgi:hypothetical protein
LKLRSLLRTLTFSPQLQVSSKFPPQICDTEVRPSPPLLVGISTKIRKNENVFLTICTQQKTCLCQSTFILVCLPTSSNLFSFLITCLTPILTQISFDFKTLHVFISNILTRNLRETESVISVFCPRCNCGGRIESRDNETMVRLKAPKSTNPNKKKCSKAEKPESLFLVFGSPEHRFLG